MRQNYAAMIELIDDWLGIYVGELQEQGALENTLVVYASDHGEMLGDFNLWAKSVPHEASVRVPLVMAGPGCRPAGEPCAAPVSLLDMGKTFLDVAGCDMTGFEGVSLRPTLQTGAAPARDLVYSGLGNWRAVSDGRFKLVAGFSQDVVAFMTQFAIFDPASIAVARLYDLDADPLEEHDVSARHPEIYRQLSEAIAADCGMPSQSTHQKNRTGDQVPS
jgi:arylsulfatase A-like enzyme